MQEVKDTGIKNQGTGFEEAMIEKKVLKGGIKVSESPLMLRSKEFALQIIKICNHIKQNRKESILTNQLVRSGTSIGANI